MTQNILIRTPNHLGDSVMALPMINQVHEAYPGSRVTVLTPAYLADLFKSNPSVDQLLTIPNDYVHGLIGVKRIVDIISEFNFDLGYILPPSFGAAAGFKLAGVSERIGYIADGRRLLLSHPLTLPTPLSSEHRSHLYFNLLRRASSAELEYVQPKLFLSGDDSARAGELLSGFGLSEAQSYLVIAPQAVAESRRWGEENYASLILSLLNQHALSVILIGGGEDFEAAEAVISKASQAGVDPKRLYNLAGKSSLRESAAIIAGGVCFVGNDSGPAHLAAAVGASVLTLSGADNPAETTPLTARKRLIYKDSLECISCVKNVCPLKGDQRMQCMKQVSVAEVAQAVNELIGD